MSFDRKRVSAAVAAHGTVARVVVAAVAGSAPREVGAALLVWRENGALAQSGTIGGGALEWHAVHHALETEGLTRHPLGPSLGQCCGGAVTLLTEIYDADRLSAVPEDGLFARGPGAMPLAVARLRDRSRARGATIEPQLIQDWMVEPLARPRRPLWIWGAGHVGRALVQTLAPLPDHEITWLDTSPDRFPDVIPAGVSRLPDPDPARLIAHAPPDAAHLILTYSHELDLQICHAALSHGFGFCGLIGSDTKRARFHNRLAKLGHSDAQITRICCPIGQKGFGKHPQAIAIGVAAQLLSRDQQDDRAWTTPSSAPSSA